MPATRTARPAPKTAAKPTPKPAPKPPVDLRPEREDGCVAGNLTFDPELRFTVNGRTVVSLNIAVNERVLNQETGEWEDTEPEFVKITVWGKMGENIAEHLVRGDRIVAIGYFEEREWEDRDGNMRTSQEFTATDIGPSAKFHPARIIKAERSKPAPARTRTSRQTDEPPF